MRRVSELTETDDDTFTFTSEFTMLDARRSATVEIELDGDLASRIEISKRAFKAVTREVDTAAVNIEEYRQVVADSQAAVWRHHRGDDSVALDLRPPAAPDRIAAAGQRLGTAVPGDLATLLLAVDGGAVLGDGPSFCPVGSSAGQVDDEERIPLVDCTLAARDTVARAESVFHGRVEHRPRPDIVALTDPGQCGLWYEISGPSAGSILYYDVLALEWGIIEVAPSLDDLLLAARDSNRVAGEFLHGDATVHIFERYQIDRRLFR